MRREHSPLHDQTCIRVARDAQPEYLLNACLRARREKPQLPLASGISSISSLPQSSALPPKRQAVAPPDYFPISRPSPLSPPDIHYHCISIPLQVTVLTATWPHAGLNRARRLTMVWNSVRINRFASGGKLTLRSRRCQALHSNDEASKLLNKDVCIAAHVYDVVELPNGTRYLDVCTPQTPTISAASPSSASGKTTPKWANCANTRTRT